MEYVYAALLLHSAGKDVTEEGIRNIVTASGVAADDVRIKALVAALEGVDITAVLSQAAAVPVAAAAAPVAAATATAAAAPAAEEEEESKEAAEESGVEGLGALFG
ncbi:MAG: 50S ribosomal protein P1 [Methanothrix sp.]|jgi:large subunit ribosomal protein L12|uniref:50S ribosomal protein P1 n=1 Tax=Methanothrix sp. TaxID=90426 RepID=UPI001BD491CA|nr:50S ribosomal protein P1 [Methanothrix sp.]MBK7385313.1 50S ribosomal protein P1 [Methanothrix sp.]HPW73561.1 50S ribosomal protein P1 [Methanothrix sp.]